MEQNDYFYKRLKCSREEYKKITANLSEKELNLIKKVNKDNEIFRELETQTLYIKLKNILGKERAKIEETIYVFFDGHPKEDVDAVIKDLNEHDKNILFLRYGKDFKHPVRSENWTEEHQNYFFNELIPKMKIKLETLHITPIKVKKIFKTPVKIDKEKDTEKTTKKEETSNKGTSLYAMYPEIKKEDLKLIVYCLEQTQKRALHLRHGETLNSYKYLSLIDFRKIEPRYNAAIVLLDKIALEYKRTLKDKIEFDENNLELLTQDEKKTLAKIHGENYDKTLPTFVLNQKEKELYAKALKILKNGLQQIKPKKENLEPITSEHLKTRFSNKTPSKKTHPSVTEVQKKSNEEIVNLQNKELKNTTVVYFRKSKEEAGLIQNKFPNKTLEEIKEEVKKLTKKQQEAIYARHGENLDTYNEWNKEKNKKYAFNYHYAIKTLNSILCENKQTKEEKKLIQNEFSGKTLEEMKEAVKELPKKQQEAIYARYGENLDTYNKWNKEETKKYRGNYYNAISDLDAILHEKKQIKKELIEKYSKIEVSQLKEIVMLLPEKQQEAIYTRHETDLDQHVEWNEEKSKEFNGNYFFAIKNIEEIIFYLTTPIFKIFEGKEDIVSNIIESLDGASKNTIKKLHGKQLLTINLMNVLSLEEKKTYLSALKKISKLIQNQKNREITAYKKLNENEDKKRKKLKSIYKVYPNYSKDQIDEAISCLTDEEKNIFDLRNGKDYENPSSSPSITKKEKLKYNQIVYKIGEILVLNNQTLFEYYSFYSKQEIANIISRLGLKVKEDLQLLYGIDYCHPIGYKKIVELNLKASRKKVLQLLSGGLLNLKYYIDYNKIYKLYDRFDKNTLDEIIQSLKKAYKDILVLNEKNMLDEDNKEILNMEVIPEIETRLNNASSKKDEKSNPKDEKTPKKAYRYITDVPKSNNKDKIKEKRSGVFEGQSEWVNLSINVYGELIHFNISYNGVITKENQKTLEIMIGTALKEALLNMKKEIKKEYLLQAKFPDKTLEEIKEAVKKLTKKQQEAIYERHGKELDTYNKWNREETKKYSVNYYYAIKKLNSILYENKQSKEEAGLIQNKFSDKTLEEIKEAVKKLPKKQQEAIYERHGENLDTYNEWNREETKKYSVNYCYAIKTLNSILYTHQKEYLKDNKLLTTSKNKANISKKEQPSLVVKKSKDPLEKEKQKLKFAFYDKYYPIYKDFITPQEMEIIVDESVNSYQIEENINMEVSSTLKIEAAIYRLLSKKYRENMDNEIGLNILLLVEELCGNKIKEKYADFSQGDISDALLKTLENYSGEKTFFIEMLRYLKKKSN